MILLIKEKQQELNEIMQEVRAGKRQKISFGEPVQLQLNAPQAPNELTHKAVNEQTQLNLPQFTNMSITDMDD